MIPLNSPVTNFKYCTIYGKTQYSNVKKIFHYVCYTNQICCDHGCCPQRSTRYYKSWCFWLFIFGTMLGCYLLCWYCKRLEKERQAVRVTEDHGRSAPRILPPSFRSVEVNSVDHLLETLILSYRNHLAPDRNQSTHNIDGIKLLSNIDPPPKYVDALKMPKPQKPNEVITTIIESSGGENITSIPKQNHHNGSQHDNNLVVVVIDDDDAAPSYEEAIKKI